LESLSPSLESLGWLTVVVVLEVVAEPEGVVLEGVVA
jgi:hypothetical protein